MPSGNFIVGKNLSLSEFNKYLKPSLEKSGVMITDIIPFLSSSNSKRGVLVSLYSKSRPISLGTRLENAFDDAVKEIRSDLYDREGAVITPKEAYGLIEKLKIKNRYQLGTIATYQGKYMASREFQDVINMLYL